MDSHALVTVWVLSAIGLCLCQNDLQVDAPPYGEAGQRVEFTITNPPPPPFFIVTWRLKEKISNVTAEADQNELAEFNNSVTLTCSASGTLPSFRWFNRSTIVTGSDRVLLDKRSLTILNVTRYDDGPFNCEAWNNISNMSSNHFKLTIHSGPDSSVVSVTPEDPFYSAGSDITLSCSSESNPAAQFQWALNGTLLGSEGSELRLENVTTNQSGAYTCWAYNNKTLRYKISSPQNITVLEKISDVHITHPGDVLIANKNSVNLTCDARGSIVTREWTKDEQPLSSNRITFHEENRRVSISPVQKEDNGEYTCQVRNPVSSLHNVSKLIVNYGPENTKIEVKGEIVLGSQITLTCSAESIPDSTYTWTFNEIEIQSGASYVIQESADEDSGNYTCTALNSITKLRNTAIQELKIQEKPNGLSTGAIVGIVIGVIIILAAVSGLTFYFVKKKGKMGAPKPHQARTINGSVELNYADISHFQRKNVQRVDQGNGGNGETLYSGVRLPSSPAGPTSGQGPTYADINFQNNAAGMRPTLGHGGNVGDQSTVYAAVKPKGQAPRPPHQVPDVTYAQVRK
ncbi:cell adhesion molecule CEACAM20-like isoform X2 [Alosa pseudoharengus]|uniref:cell adhesion molecule CEACAM20-like isoform X2 n=1 Tax=Alosa pseudoharengus TaxID=34774 RepID=UPI003F895F4E